MRRLGTGLTGVVIVLLLVLYTLPFVVRDQLVLWLYSQGVDDARLKQISVNWFTGRLQVKGLSVERQGYTPLRLELLDVDLDLAALLDQQLLIESVQLTGLKGGISDQPDQLWLGPIPLPASQPSETSEPESPSTWQLGLNRLQIDELSWLSQWQGARYPLTIKAARLTNIYQWAPLTRTDLMLDGAFDGAPLNISSAGQPLQQRPELSFELKLDRIPLNSLMAMLGQPLNLRLSADQKIRLQLNPLTVAAEGGVKLHQVSWKAEQSASASQVSWDGKADWDAEKSKASFDGGLTLSGTQAELPEQLSSTLKSLQFNGAGEVIIAPALNAVVDGKLKLEQLQADTAQQQTAMLERLGWQGKLKLALQGEQLSLESRQQTQLAGVDLKMPGLQATLASLDNNSSVTLNGSQWQLELPALQLGALEVVQESVPLVAFDALALESLTASPDTAELSRLSLNTLKLAQQQGSDQPISQWRSLVVDQVGWTKERLQIKEIILNGGESHIRRGASGALTDIEAVQQRLAALTGAGNDADVETEATESDAKADAAMEIQLGSLSIREPHQLHFADQSVTPAFNFDGAVKSLAVGPWDNRGKRPTDLNLQAQLNGDGEMTLHGVLDTGSMQSGGWTLDISGVEMPYLSPYSMEYTGYYIQSGQLDLNSKGTLVAGKLDGKTSVGLNNFDVEPRKQDKVGKVSQQLSMPLETAVMVLEDDDENIHLDLELKGSLDDPDFGYQSVINSLAGKGLKTAAFSYLTKALQPYATIASLAKTAIEASEKGTFISLQPVNFKPASAALSSDMKGYMAKLTEMLAERPAMRLKLCGNAVAADQNVLKPQLEAENKKRKKPLEAEALAAQLQQRMQTLAEQRSAAVKAALATKVEKKRLFVCYPDVNAESDEAPTVSVGI